MRRLLSTLPLLVVIGCGINQTSIPGTYSGDCSLTALGKTTKWSEKLILNPDGTYRKETKIDGPGSKWKLDDSGKWDHKIENSYHFIELSSDGKNPTAPSCEKFMLQAGRLNEFPTQKDRNRSLLRSS